MKFPFATSTSAPVDQVPVTLTVDMWREVAERAASDYHDWMDAVDRGVLIPGHPDLRTIYLHPDTARRVVGYFTRGETAR